MPLYHVQDSDRPMYVLADGWGEAVKLWQDRIRLENEEPDQEYGEPDQPQGVNLVCDDDEFLMVVEAPSAKDKEHEGLVTERGRLAGRLADALERIRTLEREALVVKNPTRDSAARQVAWNALERISNPHTPSTVEQLQRIARKAWQEMGSPDPSDEKMCLSKGDILYFGIPDWMTVRANGFDVVSSLRLRVQLVRATPICDPPHDGMQWDAELDCTEVPDVPDTPSVIVLTKGLPE